MPIYEYNCPKCCTRFELLRPLSEAGDNAQCPKCKMPSKRAVSKFVSRAKDDLGYLSNMAAGPGGSGGSCSGCSSTNCSTCGG